jgi:hypothetical protein
MTTPSSPADDSRLTRAVEAAYEAARTAAATPPPPAPTEPTEAPPAEAAAPADRRANLVAGPGGVMTDEVGVVTGDLTLRSEYADGHVTLRVQYQEADEWYAVTGGRVPLHDPADLDAVHTVALALLHRPEG